MSEKPLSSLFRYFPAASSNFFTEGKLWFSRIQDLNDSFEGSISSEFWTSSVTEILFNEANKSGPRTLNSETKQRLLAMVSEVVRMRTAKRQSRTLGNWRVLSFSAVNTSILLWSHYASFHRGFVLEFDLEHQFFKSHPPKRVNYVKAPPEFLPKRTTEERLGLLSVKWDHWAYEAEWRLIVRANCLKVGWKHWAQAEGGYLPLPANLVKAVYFGCRTENQMQKCMMEDAPPSIEFHQMQMVPDKYQLESVPVTR